MKRTLRVDGGARRIGPALDALEACLEEAAIPPEIRLEVRLLAEEAITNVIRHAAAPGPPAVEVEVEIDRAAVRLVVRDDGEPFDPLSVPARDLEAAREGGEAGGLGIPLIRSLADEAGYERSGGYNVLRLVKLLKNG